MKRFELKKWKPSAWRIFFFFAETPAESSEVIAKALLRPIRTWIVAQGMLGLDVTFAHREFLNSSVKRKPLATPGCSSSRNYQIIDCSTETVTEDSTMVGVQHQGQSSRVPTRKQKNLPPVITRDCDVI